MTTEQRLKLFEDILGMLKTTELKEFAKVILTNADEYFFTMPASTTGKYHPAFALGDGGLVRHTKAVAMIAATIADSLGYDEQDTDSLIVAAIAHDIKKKGNGGSKWTTKDHPVCAYEYVLSLPTCGVEDWRVQKIALAIRSHMGRWGEYPPSDEFEKSLQEADLIASRKWLNINFPPVSLSDGPIPIVPLPPVEQGAPAPAPAAAIFAPAPILNEQASPATPPVPPAPAVPAKVYGTTEIWFGKHKGKTVKDICEHELDYVNWLLENFSNPGLLEDIRGYLTANADRFVKIDEYTYKKQ